MPNNRQFYFMSIDKTHTNISHHSQLQTQLNEFQLREPTEGDKKDIETLEEGSKIAETSNPPPIQQKTVDYREPEVVQYFRSKQLSARRWQEMSNNLLLAAQSELNDQIKSGTLKIAQQSKSLAKNAEQPKQPEDAKIILQKKSTLEKQLKSIQEELSKLTENREVKYERREEISQSQHQKFVERMVKVRRQAENKRRLLLEYDQQKIANQLKKEEQQRRLSQEKLRAERQSQIKQKIAEKEVLKKQQLQEQKQSAKRYKQLIQQKQKYQLMRQKYETNCLLPMLEQQKQILKQRSARFKGYSIDQIRNFEKEYDRSKENSQNSNSSKVAFEYKPPPYYSHKIHQILEEERVKEKIRLQAAKRALEEKIERQANYAQYVKDSISIKIDQKKKLDLLLLNKQKQPKDKSKSQLTTLGNKYMYEHRVVKSELRRENYSTREVTTELSKEEKKKSNTAMNQGEHDKFMRDAYKQRISKILASKSVEKGEKMDKLKIQADRLSQRIKRNEQMKKVRAVSKQSGENIEELLASIKAKVGMIDLLKQ